MGSPISSVGGNNPLTADQLFDDYQNTDGTLDVNAYAQAQGLDPTQVQKEFDANQDGKVTRQEFTDTFTKVSGQHGGHHGGHGGHKSVDLDGATNDQPWPPPGQEPDQDAEDLLQAQLAAAASQRRA